MLRNDPLLIHYPIRIREVTIGVILFLTFTFYFFPRFLGEGQRTNFSVVDEIDFTDIAVLQVTGLAKFENSLCPVEGVDVLHGSDEDGWSFLNPPVKTNELGRFEIEFSPMTSFNIRLAVNGEVTEGYDDCGLDGLCPEDDGYTAADAGEGDGYFDPEVIYTDINNNNEGQLEVFENSKSEKEDLTKEAEMFEESNLEGDFEIPAFLRRQKN